MQNNLEKFENTSLYLPFRLPSIQNGGSFTEVGLQRTEIWKRSVRWQVWTMLVPRVPSLPPREDHGNDVRCGRLTTELTVATRPWAQVNDLRMLYWLLNTATGSRFQTGLV